MEGGIVASLLEAAAARVGWRQGGLVRRRFLWAAHGPCLLSAYAWLMPE
jgi:hypothetical protein